MISIAYKTALITLFWLISLSVAGFAFVLAEFGGPVWVFALCGIWMVSLGLPTTLSLVGLAFLWGDFPVLGTPSLLTFVVSGAVVSLLTQTIFTSLAIRFLGRGRKP